MIELGLPWDAYLAEPITPGDELESTRDVSADGTSLTWTTWQSNKATYELQVPIDDGEDPELSYQRTKLQFWRHQLTSPAHQVYRRFWLTEADVDYMPRILCGWGDGSTTTFPVPINGLSGSSDVGIYVNDRLQTSGYTVVNSSQLLTDQLSSCRDGTTDGWVGIPLAPSTPATLTADRRIAAEGICSVRVDGTDVNSGARASTLIPVSPSTEYSFTAHCIGDGTVRSRIVWFNGAVQGGNSDSGAVSISDTVWTEVSTTGTSDSDANLALLQIYRTTTDSTPYWFDLLGFSQGATSRVWLPSVSPGLVIFDSAPASGAVIHASGEGKRMTPVREDSDKVSWQLDVAGQPQMRLRLTEQLPLMG
jgi:hypothetical protein